LKLINKILIILALLRGTQIY